MELTGLMSGPLCANLTKQTLHNQTSNNKCRCHISKWSEQNWNCWREEANGDFQCSKLKKKRKNSPNENCRGYDKTRILCCLAYVPQYLC